MKHILILGSEGFIGNHLVNYFLDKGFTVYGCDLFETSRYNGYKYVKVSRLSPEWNDIFSERSYDFCINAAGSGNVSYSMTHPLSDFESNTLDNIRVLDSIHRYNSACRYLHISSAAVYGNPEKLPINEGDRKIPMSPYGWHKLMAEQICSEYHLIYGISTAIVRPFSVYGNGLRKQLLWDICTKVDNADTVSLYGTGNESRDFIHVSDLAVVIGKIIENSPFTCNVYNAASGTETRISQIAGIFEQHYQGNKKMLFSGEEKKGDPINWRADISAISSLGFKPAMEIDRGIQDYIKWYSQIPKTRES